MMASRIGLIRCMQSAVELAKPILSASPLAAIPQRCHLWTLQRNSMLSLSTTAPKENHVQSCQNQGLLNPGFSSLTLNVDSRSYRAVLRPRLHCRGCYFAWRHGRKFVECSDVPSHKQMKKLSKRTLWLEDYTKGDVRKAMIWHRDLKRIDDRLCDRTAVSHNWLASRLGKDV